MCSLVLRLTKSLQLVARYGKNLPSSSCLRFFLAVAVLRKPCQGKRPLFFEDSKLAAETFSGRQARKVGLLYAKQCC